MAGEDEDAEDGLGGGEVGLEESENEGEERDCGMHDAEMGEVGVVMGRWGEGMGEIEGQLRELEVRLGKEG